MARRETSVCNEAAAWPNALEALKRRTRSQRVMRPNENKMSDGGRERASLGVEVWKSSQK